MSRGGKRAGAGRKPFFDTPMVAVGLALPEEMRDAVDELRGKTPRQAWLREAVAQRVRNLIRKRAHRESAS